MLALSMVALVCAEWTWLPFRAGTSDRFDAASREWDTDRPEFFKVVEFAPTVDEEEAEVTAVKLLSSLALSPSLSVPSVDALSIEELAPLRPVRASHVTCDQDGASRSQTSPGTKGAVQAIYQSVDNRNSAKKCKEEEAWSWRSSTSVGGPQNLKKFCSHEAGHLHIEPL